MNNAQNIIHEVPRCSLMIGGVALYSGLMLAPMAGVTDTAFRLVCREVGGYGLMFTEMVSAKGLCNSDTSSLRLASVTEAERPIAIQLFGSDPNIIARAIGLLNDSAADFFDINMGCPMPKITKNGEGSALMTEPVLAGQLMRAAVKASRKPVTAKIRKGWNESCVNAVEIAKILADAGAAAVTVHGRTRDQMYSGLADWEVIGEVKRAVSGIPVIGNGDVRSTDDARRMIAKTNCDAVMVGRAARGAPWLFCDMESDAKARVMRRHFEYSLALRGDKMGVLEMRKHLAWYIKGVHGAAAIRDEIFRLTSADKIMELISEVHIT